MQIVKAAALTFPQKKAIHVLWNQEYPKSLQHQEISDLEAYLDGLAHQQHYFLLGSTAVIEGWGLSFTRNDQTWFAIILDHTIQGLGYGSRLLHEIKKNNTELNGWVIDHDQARKENGETYASPLAFYLKNDFVVLADSRLESEKITAAAIRWTAS